MRRPTWRRRDPHLGPGRRRRPTARRRRRPARRRPPRLELVHRGPSRADPAHPRDARPARPELLGARAGHPPARRPRRPRGVPVEHDPGLHRRARRAAADARGPRLLARPARRVHHPAPRGHLGRATSPSTSRSSSRTSPAPTSATARPARPARPGQYNCIYEYREEQVGLEAGRMAVGARQPPRRARRPGRRLRLRARARAAHPARRAPGLRAVDAGAHRRGGQPRHPVHPARPPLARPVRPRRPPAADPGDDDVADVGDRGRHRVGQEPDQPAARLGRAAGAALGGRRDRGGGRRRGASGSASRASSSRSTATTAAASTSTCAPRRPSAPRSTARCAESRVGRRRRRDLRRRQRLPLPRHRRQGRRHRRARAGVGDRRRRAHRPRAGRDRQQRPAARHRPREGADPDHGRRGGRGARRAPRASRSTTSRPTGTWVKLALTGNMSTGGTSIDRTIEAHPDNVEIAETAAQIVGLDVAGIDFICPDIATPVRETGGAIVEVNAAPGFRMHTHPTEGEPQYVARPVIDLLFPPGSSARIPIIAVTGTNGKTTTVRMIAHILKLMGRRVGMTSTDGIVVDGRLIKKGDMSGPEVGPDGAPEPDRRHGRVRGGPRRDPARGPRLRPQRRGRRDQRHRRPPRPRRHRPRSASWRTSRAWSSRPCRARGRRSSTPTTPHVYRMGRHCAGRVVLFSMADDEGRGRLRPRRRPHRPRRRGVLPRGHGRGRADRPPARAADDAGPVHAPHPGDVRRPGADERRERAGRGRRGVGRGRPPPRHPPGPADVHDVVLPGARAGSTCSRSAASASSSTTATTSTGCASWPTS